MTQTDLHKRIAEILAIEAEEARAAGALGFMARVLTQATMPHSRCDDFVFTRRNGAITLYMTGHPKAGLPYGSYPRLLLSWMTTEAVRTRSSCLEMGPSLSSFMAELGLVPAGGRWGTIHRLRDQMRRLFSTSVACEFQDERQDSGAGFRITRKHQTWWDPKQPEQASLWRSYVELSQDFYDEVVDRAVPIDMRALKALKRSPLALDVYCWLTYRFSYLKRETLIPWAVLQMQFGARYADTRQGRYDFRRSFAAQLKKVLAVYPNARAAAAAGGLRLTPSLPHVPPARLTSRLEPLLTVCFLFVYIIQP